MTYTDSAISSSESPSEESVSDDDDSTSDDEPMLPGTPGPCVAPSTAALQSSFPPDPALVSFPSFYSNAATFEGGGWSMSKTVPLHWENADSWTPTSPMAEHRLHHTATYLGEDGRDNRTKVLVAGGGRGPMLFPLASKSTELFDPLDADAPNLLGGSSPDGFAKAALERPSRQGDGSDDVLDSDAIGRVHSDVA